LEGRVAGVSLTNRKTKRDFIARRRAMVERFSLRGRTKSEEGFLSAQADTFAGANVNGKGVGLLRSK